jgi:hypothetical protein
MAGDEGRTSVERLLAERQGPMPDGREGGRLTSRARQTQRSVEAYLQSGARPRWMERLVDIDRGIARERRRLARALAALRHECRADPGAVPGRWAEVAAAWDFGELNVLIEQHNAWYPIERDLPMNPRTGEYVTAGGRPFRRPVLDADWILAEVPADARLDDADAA